MSAPSLTVVVPLLAILAAATFHDLRTRRIPNGLSLGGAALGLLINAVVVGPSALVLAVLGWALCLVCFLPLYLSGGTAAGDVKLMAMVGAFLGPMNGFLALLFTLVAGALLAALTVAKRNLVQSRQPLLLHSALDKIPYATAIALGALAAVVQPLWMTNVFR
jgi:prepilin peptidase CpaA